MFGAVHAAASRKSTALCKYASHAWRPGSSHVCALRLAVRRSCVQLVRPGRDRHSSSDLVGSSVDDFDNRRACGTCAQGAALQTLPGTYVAWRQQLIVICGTSYGHVRVCSCTAAFAWRKQRGALPAPMLAPAHLSAHGHAHSVACKTATWIRVYGSAYAVSRARRYSSSRQRRWCTWTWGRGRHGRARNQRNSKLDLRGSGVRRIYIYTYIYMYIYIYTYIKCLHNIKQVAGRTWTRWLPLCSAITC